jgi:hemoglobin
MLVEYIRYELTSSPALFEAAYLEASKSLRTSPHCLGYELARALDTPTRYVLRIVWDSAAGHLEGFRKSPEFAAFFAAIAPFVKEITEMQHYQPTGVLSRTVADAFGGPAALMRLARTLHERLRQDALLGPRFADAVASHVPHLGMWLSEVFGGPRLYTALLGDIAPMLARHANLEITEDERVRFVSIASDSVRALAPPQTEPAVAAMIRYFEWGSRVAVENARRGHQPNPSAGVPSWVWQD